MSLVSPLSPSDLFSVTLDSPGALLSATRCYVAYGASLSSSQISYQALPSANCVITHSGTLFQSATLKSVCTTSSLCSSGAKLTIGIEGVAMLYSGGVTGNVVIKALTSLSQVFSQSSVSLSALSLTPYQLPSLNVTRSSTSLGQAVTLHFQASLPILWQKDSHLLITIPTSRQPFLSSAVQCTLQASSAPVTQACTLSSLPDNSYLLVEQTFCASSPEGHCPDPYSLDLAVSAGFSNPAAVSVSTLSQEISM